jgi:SET domain-containing protein
MTSARASIARPDNAFHADMAVVRHSPVSGDGTFAAMDIPKGTRILPLTGTVQHRDKVDWNADIGVMQIGDDKFLVADGQADDYINHSCDPNVAFTPDGMGYFALKDIAKGDELFADYATHEYDAGWSVKCLCGSSKCRGQLTGFADLDAATQKRLLPYALPYIRIKFSSADAA